MNTKRFMLWSKYTLLVAVVCSLVAISSCSDDDPDGPVIYDGSLLALINDAKYKQSATVTADNALDSLTKLVAIYPSLTAILGSTTTDYTLFAPSNTAFINLLATPGFPEAISQINPDIIEGVLAYHVVAAKLAAADLTPTGTGAGINTLYSNTNSCTGVQTVQVIKVNATGTLLTGSTNLAIEVQSADNFATKGVMHLTKTVLIPPSVGESLTPILGRISATILLGADFTALAKFINKADCATTNTADKLVTILSGTDLFTAFLPPNPVFEGTAVAVLGSGKTVDDLLAAFTPAQCRQIVLNHVVAGSEVFDVLTQGKVLTTSLDPAAKLTVTVFAAPGTLGKFLTTSGGTTGLLGGGGTTQGFILVKDISASNGVSHVVSKILIPN